jgi:antitoxin ParD1/3/4
MDTVTLPPELERFAEEAVAAGRFPNLSAVVAAGVSLLQRQEQARADFVASLAAAEAEAEREGWHSLDDVMAEADQIIAAKRGAA